MIASPLLPNTLGLIDGKWVGADAGATIAVHDPATGEVIAQVPHMASAEARRAMDAASRAFGAEPEPPVEARRLWLTRIAATLRASADEFARIITLEQGKPMRESVAETQYAAGFFEWFVSLPHALLPREITGQKTPLRWTVHHRPAGVVGLITPWNFPLAMLAKKLSAALMAGCAIVIKPSELTPLSAIALCKAALDAGVPAGRLHLVIGQADPIGAVMCEHPAVRVISFTGSTRVGKILLQRTAPHVKRLALELGGNAPFIVFDDADMVRAVEGLFTSKFRAGGQTCVCANRVLVHEPVRERFNAAVARRLATLKLGPGIDATTDIGPLIHRDAWDKVDAHVRDAIERGAKRISGDTPHRPMKQWPAFYPPTLIDGVRPEMLVCREETFGPLVAVIPFTDESQVITLANDTPYGLAAYLFTADRTRAARVAAALHFGHVGVNTGSGPAPWAPFGGMKQSGLGREGGLEGLLEYCDVQTIASGE